MVVNDSELVVAAGTPEGWGVALISGAGSVCLARSPQGRTRASEAGATCWATRAAATGWRSTRCGVATQTVDGRADAQALLRAILKHWSLADANALIRHVHAPGMTPVRSRGARQRRAVAVGERRPAAKALVEQSVKDLARQVDTAIRRLALEKPPLALSGSPLRGEVRRGLLGALASPVGDVAYVEDPCRGAVTLAQATAQGSEVAEALRRRRRPGSRPAGPRPTPSASATRLM